MASGFARLKSQPEVSADYPRTYGLAVGRRLRLIVVRYIWGGWRRGRGAETAVQFNERTVSTCEATGSQNTREEEARQDSKTKKERKDIQRAEGPVVVCC